RLLSDRMVQRLPLAVHAQYVHPRVEDARGPRRGVAGDALALVGRHLDDDIGLALQEGRDARRRLRDRPHDPAVHVDLAAPVAPVGVEDGPVVLDPGAEADGPGTDRLGVEGVVADRLDVLLRHDLAAIEGQPRGQQRVGLLGVYDERVWHGPLDALDGAPGR